MDSGRQRIGKVVILRRSACLASARRPRKNLVFVILEPPTKTFEGRLREGIQKFIILGIGIWVLGIIFLDPRSISSGDEMVEDDKQ